MDVFVAVGETGTRVSLALGATRVDVALGKVSVGVAWARVVVGTMVVGVVVGANGVALGTAWVVEIDVDVIGAEGEFVDMVAV